MSKKRQKTTIIKEEEEIRTDESPLSRLIKNFFDTGEFHPDLDELQFEIRVMKWDKKQGKYGTLHGVHFNDLDGMMDVLGEKFGNARYKFFVKAKSAEGKVVAGAVIEDYELVWGGDEALIEGSESDYVEENVPDSSNAVIEMMKIMMQQQNNLLLAMINNQGKGGATPGGTNFKEMIEVLKTGIELGQGNVPEGQDDLLSTIIKSPLGQVLAQKIFEGKSPTPEGAQHLTAVEQRASEINATQ